MFALAHPQLINQHLSDVRTVVTAVHGDMAMPSIGDEGKVFWKY